MFETDPEINAAVDAVYRIASKLKRGDVLTHDQIRCVLGLEPHEGRWDHIINRVRRRLEGERGIATWPETTVGYRLLTTAEQIKVLAWRSKRAQRQVRRGRRSVQALPEAGLSVNQRRARAMMIDHGKRMESEIRQTARRMAVSMRPTPTLPKRASALARAAVVV